MEAVTERKPRTMVAQPLSAVMVPSRNRSCLVFSLIFRPVTSLVTALECPRGSSVRAGLGDPGRPHLIRQPVPLTISGG